MRLAFSRQSIRKLKGGVKFPSYPLSPDKLYPVGRAPARRIPSRGPRTSRERVCPPHPRPFPHEGGREKSGGPAPLPSAQRGGRGAIPAPKCPALTACSWTCRPGTTPRPSGEFNKSAGGEQCPVGCARPKRLRKSAQTSEVWLQPPLARRRFSTRGCRSLYARHAVGGRPIESQDNLPYTEIIKYAHALRGRNEGMGK